MWTLQTKLQHHIAKAMTWFLERMQDNNVLQRVSFLRSTTMHMQGINSANNLVVITNIGNQLYSSFSQLARKSFLMQTIANNVKCVRV